MRCRKLCLIILRHTPPGIFIVCFLIAALLPIVLPIPSGLAQEKDYLIVPGHRVGRWELGRPLEAYGLGRRSYQWEGTAGRRAYYDGYAFPQTPRGPFLQVYTCRGDNQVFAVLVVQRLDLGAQLDAEELKSRTAEGVGIGMDESDIVRILGRPEHMPQFPDRHGQLEILVRQHD